MYTKGWLVLFGVIVTSPCTLLNPAQKRNNDSVLVVKGSSLPSNLTSLPLNNSSLMSFSAYDSPLTPGGIPHCDGRVYGLNLKRTSCFDAWTRIGLDKDPMAWERRGSGVHINPKLPFRFSSGK